MILIFTGNGKGKTTAALGQGLRAVGDGKRVLMMQFIKGPWKSGEEEAVKKFGDDFKIVKGGLGFVGMFGDDLPFGEHQKAAEETWEYAKKEILSSLPGQGEWDMVILDEINNAIHLKLVLEKDVLDFLAIARSQNPKTDIILTGRDASESLMGIADLVTEMKEIKHPFQKGEAAKKGIEF